MSAFKYIVPALAIAGQAAAQCSAATTTIQNAGDAAGLRGCQTFTGSIALATGTTDNIALDGIRTIQGSLIADNVTQITQLSGSSLETITDSFTLNGLTILSTLNFPRLVSVDTIAWTALPALQGLSFTTGVQEATNLDIENTQLNSLSGINLQVIDTLKIANNPYLQEINMQLGNVTKSMTIEANGNAVDVTLPNMIWAYNITMRNVSTVSMPSLRTVNGSLGFYSNTFDAVSAANLTSVGGSLSFVSNTDLANVSMPMLRTIGGGFQIANNTMLKVVDGFTALTSVSGALDFNGNFTSVALPALKDIKGAFNLQSSADISANCTTFKALSGTNNVIKGKFVCAGSQAKPSGAGSNPTGTATGTSSSSSSTAKSSANTVYVSSAAAGFMGLVAVAFGML